MIASGAVQMAKKKTKQRKRVSRGTRIQQILFIAIAVLVIASFIISLISF
jgi:hypothetical protein